MNIYLSKRILVAFASAGFWLSALAAPPNIVDHGSYLTDTTAGLDWMDITPTLGLGYNTALGANASFGWRVATLFEFESLVGNWGTPSFLLPEGTFAELISMMTNSSGSNGVWGFVDDRFDDLYFGMGEIARTSAFSDQSGYSLANESEGYYSVSYTNAGLGTFLVRNSAASPSPAPVPEPETYAMMLAGLGLLCGMAKRSKARQ